VPSISVNPSRTSSRPLSPAGLPSRWDGVKDISAEPHCGGDLGDDKQGAAGQRIPVAVVASVSALERRGWVTRHPAAGNRRITPATLTEAGYAKVVESAPARVETVHRSSIDPLTKQQLTELGRVSETILTELNRAQ
jgi:hypothetical protein